MHAAAMGSTLATRPTTAFSSTGELHQTNAAEPTNTFSPPELLARHAAR